jgi:alkanesulfonate monooxygenase SsuD/methylene tetrahydromethanopterin reductase-like flavin-dependent oxidoreductase (luciferase family)
VKRLEFGVRLKNYGSWTETKEAALAAEKSGFTSIWLNDHLLPPAGPLDVPFREAWTSLSALGPITRTVQLGTLVACNSFRNPAMMAKMASTLDSITGGRVVLGIGGGWHRPEYDAYGFAYPAIGERMARLEEGVRIIRMMLQQGKATFNGKYHTVKEAPSIPVPNHKVPVWIGGGGPRLVRMAARLADGWNCYRMRLEEFKTRQGIFEQECKRAGRERKEVTISLVTDGMVSALKSNVERLIEAAAFERGQTRDRYRLDDSVIIGNGAEAAARIREYQKAGVDHLILNFPSLGLIDQLEYFGAEVIPQFA